MGKTLTGPGKTGSMSKLKKTLASGANEFIRNIPGESSLTVRFLDEPEDFFGYYEHWVDDRPLPCSDDCDGCNSDDPEEQRKMFRYLANAYVVDDQKVRAVKLPKTLVQQLVDYHTKFDGTLRDRDYDLSKSGSGKNGTRYMASPDSPRPMKLKRFEDQKKDLQEVLMALLDGAGEDDETPKKKKKGSSKPTKKKESNPWDDVDEKPRSKKSASKSKTKANATRRVVKRK